MAIQSGVFMSCSPRSGAEAHNDDQYRRRAEQPQLNILRCQTQHFSLGPKRARHQLGARNQQGAQQQTECKPHGECQA